MRLLVRSSNSKALAWAYGLDSQQIGAQLPVKVRPALKFTQPPIQRIPQT